MRAVIAGKLGHPQRARKALAALRSGPPPSDTALDWEWRVRMKSWVFSLFVVLIGLVMLSVATSAHHGASAYDMTKLTTLKVTVTDFQFINPHVQLAAEVKDDKGDVEKWTAEANSPTVLSRNGWTKDTVKPGDQITLIGNRTKKGTKVLLLQKVVLSDGQELDSDPYHDY
jgi:hypothetical protein